MHSKLRDRERQAAGVWGDGDGAGGGGSRNSGRGWGLACLPRTEFLQLIKVWFRFCFVAF
jgi:hypothetical protein